MERPYVKGVVLKSFGLAREEPYMGFTPGLNVVSGRNEAGKSTLRNSIPQALFGWWRVSAARGIENTYRSGQSKRSVRLLLADGPHDIVFEREENDLFIAHDGLNMDPQEFQERYLTGVDDELYRTVFSLDAFTAPWISKDSDLTARLTTAASGTQVSPVELLSKLDDETASIFTANRQRKNVRIRNLQEDIRTLEEKGQRLQSLADELNQDALRHAELEPLLERLTQEREAARRDAESLSRSKAELMRLSKLIQEQEVSVQEAEDRIAELDGQVEALPSDESLLPLLPALERRSAETRYVKDQIKELSELGATMERSRSDLSGTDALLLDDPQLIIDELPKLESHRTEAENALKNAKKELQVAEAELEQVRAGARYDSGAEQIRTMILANQRPYFIAAALAMVAGIILALLGFSSGQVPLYGIAGIAVLGAFALFITGSFKSEKQIGTPADIQQEAIRLKATEEEVARSKKMVDLKQNTLTDLTVQIEAYLSEKGLSSAEGDLARARLYAQRARQYAEDRTEMKRLEADYKTLSQKVNAWAQEVSQEVALLADNGAPEASLIIQQLPTLLQQAQAQKQISAERSRLIRELDVVGKELVQAASKLKHTQAEQAHLLEDLDLSTDATIDPLSILDERLTQAERSRQQLITQTDELRDEYGKLSERLNTADTDGKLTDNLQQRENLRTQLDDARDEYLAVLVKKELLSRSIIRWEAERKPEIDSLADEYLATLTEGRWSRIVVENSRYHVMNETGTKRQDTQLSSGTQAQLYLAIRLALIESSPDLAPAAPILMDDILVHFDAPRQRQALEAIQRIARSRQVIYFTHDAQLAAQMEDSGARHIQLG